MLCCLKYVQMIDKIIGIAYTCVYIIHALMNTSQILSLASVMLFAPLVHQYLLTEGKQLLPEEKALVMSYVSYGYSILLVFVISIVVRLFYFVRTV